MSTFTEMANEWMRKNMPLVEQLEIGQTEQLGMAHHDHEQWKEDFGSWVQERCAHREGYDDWGGVGVMHVDFCEWTVNGSCTRQTFETLLRDAGFLVVNSMVSGLFLKADLWAMGQGMK